MVVFGKVAVRRRRSLEMTQRSERRDEDKRGISHRWRLDIERELSENLG